MLVEQAIALNERRQRVSVNELSGLDYCLVGDGAYAKELLQQLVETGVTLPTTWLVSKLQTRSEVPIQAINIQTIDDKIKPIEQSAVLLGTGHFQLELIERLKARCSPETKFLDIMLHAPKVQNYEKNTSTGKQARSYAVYVDAYSNINIKAYLKVFFNFLALHDCDIRIHHPLDELTADYLRNAQFVMVWNGSITSFMPLISVCQQLDLNITYLECGFFPQHQHFYLDKCGVNAKSQLYKDDLSWVGSKELAQLHQLRKKYQDKYLLDTCDNNQGYIFVPLQVPTDSNVINHSRFKTGMQEFINYIETRYPNDDLRFKVHPKDSSSKQYIFNKGQLIEGDVFSLISGAKKVHGINSSVLYEAALLGKPIEVEGDCLLKPHMSQIDTVLAAIISRQINITNKNISAQKLSRFSHIDLNLNLINVASKQQESVFTAREARI